MWNACSQEEAILSLVRNKKGDEDENISNAYSSHHKKKGTYMNYKGPKKKVDLSNIESCNCYKMGRYKIHYPENPRNMRDKENMQILSMKLH